MSHDAQAEKWTGHIEPVPFERVIALCQGSRPAQAAADCHTELEIDIHTGAAKVVCRGDCPHHGSCDAFEIRFGLITLIQCACSPERIGSKCDLVVALVGGQLIGAFCFGACAKGQTCFPGFAFDQGKLRLFCSCG